MNALDETQPEVRRPNSFAADYLGPADVVCDCGDRVRIAFPDQQTEAIKAMFPVYHAEPGDKLLIISRDRAYYAIGVISGQGRSDLVVNGDLSIRARGGKLRLQSDEEVTVESKRISLRALTFEVLAEAATQTFSRLSQWVVERFSLRAGSQLTQVEGEAATLAQRVSVKAKEDVRIDGDRINLG